jgi:hypothetical protein
MNPIALGFIVAASLFIFAAVNRVFFQWKWCTSFIWSAVLVTACLATYAADLVRG